LVSESASLGYTACVVSCPPGALAGSPRVPGHYADRFGARSTIRLSPSVRAGGERARNSRRARRHTRGPAGNCRAEGNRVVASAVASGGLLAAHSTASGPRRFSAIRLLQRHRAAVGCSACLFGGASLALSSINGHHPALPHSRNGGGARGRG